MTRKQLEQLMIEDEYRGKPYALLIAVILGFILVVIAGIYGIIGLVNLIMYLLK